MGLFSRVVSSVVALLVSNFFATFDNGSEKKVIYMLAPPQKKPARGGGETGSMYVES